MATTGQYCFIISVVTTSACNLGQPGNRREPLGKAPLPNGGSMFIQRQAPSIAAAVLPGALKLRRCCTCNLQPGVSHFRLNLHPLGLSNTVSDTLLGDSNTDYMIQFILQLYAGRVLDLPLFHGWIVHALCILPTIYCARFVVNTGCKACKPSTHQINHKRIYGCSTVVP